jgi:CHASE2 domain-containing sensor protein/class 3 adenylate cyclase
MVTERDRKKERRIPFRKVLQGVLIGVVAGLLSLLTGFLGFSNNLELMTLDARYRMRPPVETLPEIGFIDYDDSSLQLCGEWPWPRFRQVALVNTLGRYGARMAGYDVFFLEKENTRLLAGRLKDALRYGAKTAPAKAGMDVRRLIDESFRNYDREFSAALRRSQNIYLAYFSGDPNETSAAKGLSGILEETKSKRESLAGIRKEALEKLEKTFLRVPGKDVEKALFKAVSIEAPLPLLQEAAKGTGFAQPGIDSDSVKRNYIMFRYYNGQMTYSIALKMLSDLMDFKLSEVQILPGKYVVFKNALDYRSKQRKDITVPVDDHGQFLLNWAGPFDRTFLHIPFRLLSFYYAYNSAKESIRGLPRSSDADFPALKDRIVGRITDEEMVTREEADRIGQEIAAAHLIAGYSERGLPRQEIIRKLQGHLDAGLLRQVYQVVTAARLMEKDMAENPAAAFGQEESRVLAAGLDIGREHLREIYRNMTFFAARKELREAQPYYFPPARQVNSSGRMIDFSPVDLKDKIFMIGLTGMNTIDLKPSPFEEDCPLVSYHVNALNNVLSGNYLHYPPGYYKYAATMLLSLLIGAAGVFFSIPVSFGVTVLAAAGYLLGTYKIWVISGYWLDVVVPLTGILLTFMIIIIMQFIKAFREKKKVRGIFAAMVSPAVLKIMEENPDKFSLTGERKAATTFFSMINGMGNVTKTVAPDELTNLLSIYLTPNSEIIMDYDGYIDKYEGHIIMADFGVPLDDAHNPWKCAFAAVEQWIDIDSFRYFVRAKYGLEVGVSMGFNYGYVSAGNMGSERKFQYTVMGDPVNVAARFMASNSIYNADYAITGEDTAPVISDYVHLRALDKVLLKGKTKPTAIYNVLGWKPEAYREMRGNRPVPDYLRLLWTKCPPEKIFGYHHLWRRKFEETGHPMAKEIRDFFAGARDVARVLLVNGWKREIAGYGARLADIAADLSNRMNITAGPALPAEGGNYREVLEAWAVYLRKTVEAAMAGDSLSLQVYRDGQVLLNKVDLLKTRLEQDLPLDEMIGEAMLEIKDFIPRWRTVSPDLLDNEMSEGLGRYRSAADKFYHTLRGRREPYHEMMSLAGAPAASVLLAKQHFEEGLEFYWQRRWDEALEKFRQTEKLSPAEGPVLSLIERVESYRTHPPGETWQGEFVQTKK